MPEQEQCDFCTCSTVQCARGKLRYMWLLLKCIYVELWSWLLPNGRFNAKCDFCPIFSVQCFSDFQCFSDSMIFSVQCFSDFQCPVWLSRCIVRPVSCSCCKTLTDQCSDGMLLLTFECWVLTVYCWLWILILIRVLQCFNWTIGRWNAFFHHCQSLLSCKAKFTLDCC